MLGFIAGVVAGALVIFVVPPLLPQQFQNWMVTNLVRAAGVVILVFSVLSTSFVHVPDGHLGPAVPHLWRLLADRGQASSRPTARTARRPRSSRPASISGSLVNVLYTVDTRPQEVLIPSGKVGVLTARDGTALRAGQAFADPFPAAMGYRMLDADVFLKNGGQRGPQLTVLTPGKYRLNRYLWDVSERDAKETGAGFVGVVKSNVHADVDFGTLQREQAAEVRRHHQPRPELAAARGADRAGRLHRRVGQVAAARPVLLQSGRLHDHRGRYPRAGLDLCRRLQARLDLAHRRRQGRHRADPHRSRRADAARTMPTAPSW